MVNVTDRADVAVRLRPLEFRLGHCRLSYLFSFASGPARAGPNTRYRSQAYFAFTSSATLRGTSA